MGLSVQFTTIKEMFDNVLDKYSSTDRPILKHKVDGKYVDIKYSELRQLSHDFAIGLMNLGVKKGERVALISENRPEWVVSDIAIHTLGAVDVPIYPTLTAKQIEYIFNDASIRFAIVSNQFQLNKVKKIFSEVKTLEKVIVLSDKNVEFDERILSYNAIRESGNQFFKKNPDY